MRLIVVFFLCSICSYGQIKKFSAAQLRVDLKYMTEKIEEVHPNMYHDISAADYAKLVDDLAVQLKDSMTAADAWPLFAKAIGAINEGHTQLSWPEEFSKTLTENKQAYFPFFINDFDQKGFVIETDASDENLLQPGDRIIKINGRTAEELMTLFKETVGGLPAWQTMQVIRSIRTYLALYNIIPPYNIEYVSGGTVKTAIIQGLYRKQMFDNRDKRLRTGVVLKNYNFEKIDGIGYLNFVSMSDAKGFSAFLDSVFTVLKSENIPSLIVDLRQNGGGNSRLGVDLISRFSDKPFRMAGGMLWKVSQAYKDYYSALKPEQKFMGQTQENRYLNTANGEVLEYKESTPKAQGIKDLYTGNVCFLIGPKTFSSANMLANAIKDYKLATLIGEASGESPNDYGELIFLNMPNTGIQFLTSTKQFIRANGDRKDRNPVFPDIEVKNDPATAADETLEFAKGWFTRNR